MATSLLAHKAEKLITLPKSDRMGDLGQRQLVVFSFHHFVVGLFFFSKFREYFLVITIPKIKFAIFKSKAYLCVDVIIILFSRKIRRLKYVRDSESEQRRESDTNKALTVYRLKANCFSQTETQSLVHFHEKRWTFKFHSGVGNVVEKGGNSFTAQLTCLSTLLLQSIKVHFFGNLLIL